MKKLKLVVLAFVVVAFALVVSCKKGDTGARGPAGPDSVYHSAWVPLNLQLNTTDSLYEQTITASHLTSKILDSGVILSYIGIPGSGSNGTDTAVFSISEASTFFAPLSQYFFVGEIDLVSTADYTANLQPLFRYVLIPGSVLVTNSILKGYSKEQLKAADYSVIANALGISNTKTTN
jgi:hypothetical protein